jgi:phosphatidylinositol glycan class M
MWDKSNRIWGIGLVATLSALIHIALIVYGEWQDRHMRVQYTDIDYWVYSDAARHVYHGRSAFDRHTYRYTPLLAYLLIPNELVGLWWGKAVFSAAGILSGILIYKLTNRSVVYASLWLFSPLTINISSRGSSDSLIILLILLVCYELQRGRLGVAAVWYGLSVHLRIFPIFFLIPIVLYLDKKNFGKILRFSLISGSVCLGLIALFYIKDGYRFVYEAYLYHFVRKDHRHNFSLFYYAIYLASTATESMGTTDWLSPTTLSRILTFAGFIPQLGSLIFVGIKFGEKNLPFAIFLQTVIFVAFNKVITAQYFLWYFGLLPVALSAIIGDGSDDAPRIIAQVVGAVVLWGAAEVFWLRASYRLEVESEHNFKELLSASVCLFFAHIVLLIVFIRGFLRRRLVKKEKKEKLRSPSPEPTAQIVRRSARLKNSTE